ncbi:MAG TPA: site-2 protease family protein [Desulfobacteria bacterium]|nr:site-2 protease family protein [Desulfobacteria bacterium]
MDDFLAVAVKDIPYVVIALLISFTLHELAHAYTAYLLGDPTPKEQGRLTFVPHKHLDPIGFIAIFIVGFGWAKPVEVNPDNFSKPRRDDILVSLAGPAANLLIVAFTFVVWYGAIALGIGELVSKSTYDILYTFFDNIVYLNIALFVFNLLPIPPLDGFHIAKGMFLTEEARDKVEAAESGIGLIAVIIIASGVGDALFGPIFDFFIPGIFNVFDSFFAKLFGLL